MSQDFERLVGRAILDPGFRKELLDDPEGIVKREGFAITAAELDQIRQASQDREATDRALDAVSTRAPWA